MPRNLLDENTEENENSSESLFFISSDSDSDE